MDGYCNRYPPLFKRYDYVMKKLIILVVVIVSSITGLTAQTGNQQMLKCVYLEEAINRADQPDKITQDEFVLFVSGNRSAFYSHNARQYVETKDSLERLGISPMEMLGTLQRFPKGKSIEIYKNQPTSGEYICYAEVAQTFRFEDKLPRIEWQIQDESKNILGYACQKAVGKLYNREWTVWFTMDIPVSEGPWLLAGLPGLILEANDADNIFHFTAIELSKDNTLSVEPTSKKHIKCSRKELLDYRKKFDEDPIGMVQASSGLKITKIVNTDGKEVKKQDVKRKRNYYENE